MSFGAGAHQGWFLRCRSCYQSSCESSSRETRHSHPALPSRTNLERFSVCASRHAAVYAGPDLGWRNVPGGLHFTHCGCAELDLGTQERAAEEGCSLPSGPKQSGMPDRREPLQPRVYRVRGIFGGRPCAVRAARSDCNLGAPTRRSSAVAGSSASTKPDTQVRNAANQIPDGAQKLLHRQGTRQPFDRGRGWPILLPQRGFGETFLNILWLVRRCYEGAEPVLTSVNIPYVRAIHFVVLRPGHGLLLGSE